MAFNWAPIYDNARNSMFFVMLTPSDDEDDLVELDDLAAEANTVDEGFERDDLVRATRVSTGFAVGMIAGDIGILTIAHSLEHLFRASVPISRLQINRLFTVRVLCGHYENAFRADEDMDMDGPRNYGIGRIAWIDCEHDLMLVAVAVNEVMSFGGEDDVPCPGPHPGLVPCVGPVDPATHECLMISWPSHKPDLMSVGRIGANRTADQISPNRCEYDIDILEVQMASGEGSSGAPLLNQVGEVIGVMHGLHLTDRSHTYFIGLEHVIEFLGRFPIHHPPVVP